jgi:hypothetical protein
VQSFKRQGDSESVESVWLRPNSFMKLAGHWMGPRRFGSAFLKPYRGPEPFHPDGVI